MRAGRAQAFLTRGVHPGDPARACADCRQSEFHIFMVRIEENQEICVDKFSSAFVGLLQSLARKKHSRLWMEGLRHSSSLISFPLGLSHRISFTVAPLIGRP